MDLFTCYVHSVAYLNLEWIANYVCFDVSKSLSSNR
ncbi:hypothetical protein F383_26354 [Gossypium arboreum]|uniref:Uncharacterized protein n=1 Tax=Gossypium arboreum TaxID=29729 RepID=A0A0B0MRN2_GOSAR|nr:hypothetical protein F383_26354 [Gossypium arboreum]